MRRLQWMAVCALALLLFSAMPVGAFEIGVRGYYWFPGFKADMRSDSAGLSGTDINLKDNLDVGTEAFPSVEVFGGLGRQPPGSHLYADCIFRFNKTRHTHHFQRQDLRGRHQCRYGPEIADARSGVPVYRAQYGKHSGRFLAGCDRPDQVHRRRSEDRRPRTGSGGRNSLSSFRSRWWASAPISAFLLDILEARAKMTGIGYSGNYLYEALADLSLTPFPFPGHPCRLQGHPGASRPEAIFF